MSSQPVEVEAVRVNLFLLSPGLTSKDLAEACSGCVALPNPVALACGLDPRERGFQGHPKGQIQADVLPQWDLE